MKRLDKIQDLYCAFPVVLLLLLQPEYSLCGWRPNIDEFKAECQFPLDTQYDDLSKLSFPMLTVFSGLKKSCLSCELTIQLRYSTDEEHFRSLHNNNTNVLISPYGEWFLWFDEPFVAKELEITVSGLSSTQTFQLYGCPAWKYAQALGMESGLIKDSEIHTRRSYGDSYNAFAARFNTGRDFGWYPSRGIRTTTQDDPHIRITIDIGEIKKIVVVGVQQTGSYASDFTIGYSKRYETYVFYSGHQSSSDSWMPQVAKVIKVPTLEDDMTTFHYQFKYQLLARFITYSPLIDNKYYPKIRLELYGVPRYSSSHHWIHEDPRTDKYSYMDFLSSEKWRYEKNALQFVGKRKTTKHYKTSLFSSNDCIVNPNACSSGLTVSFMAHGTRKAIIYSLSRSFTQNRMSKLTADDNCVHGSLLDIETNLMNAIYFPEAKIVRSITILDGYLQMYPFHSQATSTVIVHLRIFSGKPIEFVNNCEYSNANDEVVAGEVTLSFLKDKVVAYMKEYLNLLYNSMRWNYGNSIAIVFEPVAGKTDNAVISAPPKMIVQTVYACTTTKEDVVDSLDVMRFTAAHEDCVDYEAYRAKWNAEGFWQDCTRNSNYLEVDFAVFYHVSKIKTKTSDKDQAETFHLSFKAENDAWNYVYDDDEKYLFEIMNSIEEHPLPYEVYSRYMRLHPVSYKGDYFQIKIQVIVCTNNDFDEVMHWSRGSGGKNISLSSVNDYIFGISGNDWYKTRPSDHSWQYVKRADYLVEDITGILYCLTYQNVYKDLTTKVMSDCRDFDVYDGKVICVSLNQQLIMRSTDGSIKEGPTEIVYKARISAIKKLIYVIGVSNLVYSIDITLTGTWKLVSDQPCIQIKVTSDGILWCLWHGWIFELNSYYNDFGFVSFNPNCKDFDVTNERLGCMYFSDNRVHLFTKGDSFAVEVPIISSGLQRYHGHSRGCGFGILYNDEDKMIQVNLQTDQQLFKSSFPFDGFFEWNTYGFSWSKEQNKLNLFVNGEYVNSATGVSSTSQCIPSQNFINLGSFYDFTYLYSNNIELKNLKIWKEYLSEEEVPFTFSNTDLQYHQVTSPVPSCTIIILGTNAYFCYGGGKHFTHPKQFPMSSWTSAANDFWCRMVTYMYEKLFCVNDNKHLYYLCSPNWCHVQMHGLNGRILDIYEHYHPDWGFLLRQDDNKMFSVKYPNTNIIQGYAQHVNALLGVIPGVGNIILDTNNAAALWRLDEIIFWYGSANHQYKYRHDMLWFLKDGHVSQSINKKHFQTNKEIMCIDYEVDLLYVYCLSDAIYRKSKVSIAEVEDFSNSQVMSPLPGGYHVSSICTSIDQQTGPCYDLQYSLRGGQRQTEKSYHPTTVKLTFYGNDRRCKKLGGSFSSVHSDEDMIKISGIANEGVYLGWKSGKWLNGAEFDYDKTSGGKGECLCYKDASSWKRCTCNYKKFGICQEYGNVLFVSHELLYTTSPEHDCQPLFKSKAVLADVEGAVSIFTFNISSQATKDSMIKTAYLIGKWTSPIVIRNVYIGIVNPIKNCSDFKIHSEHHANYIHGKLIKWIIPIIDSPTKVLSNDLSDLITISLRQSQIVQVAVSTMTNNNVNKSEIEDAQLLINYYHRSESKFIFSRSDISKPYYLPSVYETSYFDSKRLTVSFWYHMHGIDIGTLIVWVKSINSIHPVEIIQGNSGSSWKQKTLKTSFNTNNIKLIFAAYRGDGPFGHIAIDSISSSSNPYLDISDSNIEFQWKYIDKNFHELLAFHGCTVPLILISFANDIRNSGSQGNLQVDRSVSISSETDKFGFFHHSAFVTRGSENEILSYPDLSNLGITTQFTILFLIRFKFWQYEMTLFQLKDDLKTFHVFIKDNQLIIEFKEIVYESRWRFENDTWTYVAITFKDGEMRIYKDNQEDSVTAFISTDNILPFPNELHFFRDPNKLGATPNDLYEGYISCFQLYAEQLSHNALKMLEFCPHRLEKVYCPYQCHLYGGVCIPLKVSCECPRSLQRFYHKGSCKNGFEDTVYHTSTFYISFDRDDVVVDHKGYIEVVKMENMNVMPSPVNLGRCMKQSDVQLAQLSIGCLTDPNCPDGFLLSIWLFLDEEEINSVLKLFSFGNLHVTYNVVEDGIKTALGNVQWNLDSLECNITFELPLKVWFFLFIGFNEENITVGVNEKLYQQICESSDTSGHVLDKGSIEFGTSKKLCIDELAGGIATLDYKAVIENYYLILKKGPILSQYVPVGVELEQSADITNHHECSSNCSVQSYTGVVFQNYPVKKCVCVKDIERFEYWVGEGNIHGSLAPYDILFNETKNYFPPVYLEVSAKNIGWEEAFNDVLSIQYHHFSKMILEAIDDHLDGIMYESDVRYLLNVNDYTTAIVSIKFNYFNNENVEDMFPDGLVLQKDLEYVFEIRRHNSTNSPVHTLDCFITEYNDTHFKVQIKNEEDFNDPFNKGFLVKIKSYVYDTTDLVVNETYSVYTGLKSFFISPVIGFRLYNIKIYRETYGRTDPGVEVNITTEAKANNVPPKFLNVEALSSKKILLSWEKFTSNLWSAPSLNHYNVFYRKVTPDFDFNMSHYKMITIPSTEIQYELEKLEVFTNYSIFLATTNDIGLGAMSHVFCRTKESVPEIAPNITSIELVESTTVNVTWLKIPNDIELMNSYYFNQYRIRTLAVYPDFVTEDCRKFKNYASNDTASKLLILRCKPMAAFNLTISVCNFIGCGKRNVYCFVLGRIKLNQEISVLSVGDINGTADYAAVNLTIGGITDETTVVTHYQIRYYSKQFSDLPESSRNITVNHTDVEMAYWRAAEKTLINCSEIIYPPVSAKVVQYELRDVYYNTEYELSASACSDEGCSDEIYLKFITFSTSSHRPTCRPPNVTLTSHSSTSLNLKFDLLDHFCLKGELIDYRVILLETKDVEGLNLTLQQYEKLGTGMWASLSNDFDIINLEEYWNYTVVVTALNEVGYGPLSTPVFGVTLPDKPTGVSMNISLAHVNASTLLVNITLPLLLERNGIILGYHLNILDEYNKAIYINATALNDLTKVLTPPLKPFAWHTIEIRAYNIIGDGPVENVRIRTLESVPSMPPANLTVEHVQSESLSISWRAMDVYSRNGILTYFNVSACGSLQNNSMHCINKNLSMSDLVEVYHYTVDCFPSVEYIFLISGCTKIGCGVSGQMNITSLEMAPYGTISNITEFDRYPNTLRLQWSAVQPMEQRGSILGYNITMVRLPQYWETVLEPVIINHFVVADLKLEITNLDNYTSYNITIAAFTKIGSGPLADTVTFTTPQNVPKTAPSSVNGVAGSSSMIYLEWLPIPPESCEGILLFYNVSYQGFDEDDYRYGSMYRYMLTDHAEIVSVNLTNLSLSTDFSIIVAGCTEAGCGPKTLPLHIKTLDFVDGAWTDWTTWGECDKSCALGTEIRQRWCTNPREDAGGRPCAGASVESRDCNDFPCPGFYLSIPSVSCSKTCTDLGDEFDCMKVVETFNDVNVFHGLIDGGDYRRSLNISCLTNPSTDKYQEKFDPSFLVDTGTCRGYKSLPNVTNCEMAAGPNVRRLCYCVDKETAQYTEWGNWGLCTKDCGVGYYRRYRECLLGSGCSGTSEDKSDCNIHPCPIHGQWGQWTPFSNCSMSCGFGSRVRRRFCDSPAPEYNGRYCEGDQHTEVIAGCNPQPCPIHGGWSEWGALSKCKHSCGSNGYRERRRSCTNPVPDFDGDDCDGDDVEHLECVDMHDCTPVLMNYLVRFTNETWHYSMYAINSHTATVATAKMKDRIHSFYSDDVHLNVSFEIEFHELQKGSIIANFTILYDSNPYTEALYFQDAIDNAHYIGDMPVTMLSLTSPHVPTIAPPNVKAETVDETSINVAWDGVDAIYLNGVSNDYYVFFRRLEDSLPVNRDWDDFATSNTFYTLSNLNPGTQYGIRVLAAVKGGNGIASEEIKVSTKDGVPFIKPPNCMYQVLTSTKIFLQWDPISKSEVPGTLVGYEIRYTTLFTRISHVLTNAPTLMQRTLYNLRANTWYEIEVYGFTNAGIGPKKTYNIQTPEGAPDAPPANVIMEEHISSTKLKLRWDAVPAEFTNGEIKGYMITYQKYQESGQDVPAKQLLHTVQLDAYTFSYVITGLSSYTTYEVKILAFTMYGNGPSVVLYGSTCKCPMEFFTNWYNYPPFISQDKTTKNNFTGLFIELLNSIAVEICTPCKTHNTSTVFYNRTKDGQPSIKINLNNVINGVGESVHFTFPIFKKFTETRVSGKYPFIPIIQSQGTAMIVYTAPLQTVGFIQMLKAVVSAWTVICIAVLMVILTGWLLFFAEQGSNVSDLTLDRSICGAAEGAWTAYVTMTTVGYGDFVPTTFLAKLIMIIWVFSGFIIVSIFSGIVTSGMTISRMKTEYKLYGSTVAAVKNSFEYRLAIQRNAKVVNYTTIPEVIEAVGKGEAEIGLIDALSTKGYEKRMKELNVRVDKMLEVVAGHGVVLSGDAIRLENDFRSYVAGQQAEIFEFVVETLGVLQPEPVTVESALFTEEETTVAIIDLVIVLAGLSLFGTMFWLCCRRGKDMKKKVKPTDNQQRIYQNLTDLTTNTGLRFSENFSKKVNTLAFKHQEERILLDDMKRNYVRYAKRAGLYDSLVKSNERKKKRRNRRNAYMQRELADDT